MASRTPPPPTTNITTPPSSSSSNSKTRVYNPHWKGYSYLFLSSLINLSATTNVPKSNSADNDDNNNNNNNDSTNMFLLYRGDWGVAVSFGASTLVFSALVLALDRTQLLVDFFHYTTACKGRLEGYTLLLLTFYCTIGVAYQTQVQGIAYTVMNIYASAWLSWAAVVYTLNLWSTKQDILSWAEMTSASATLKSWYILWLASLVVLGTSCNYYYLLDNNSNNNDSYNGSGSSHASLYPEDTKGAAIVGMVLGAGSSILSMLFILIHYRIWQPCATGGWAELLAALAVTLAWIVGCALLTQEGTIGATITGRGSSFVAFWELVLQEQQLQAPLLASDSDDIIDIDGLLGGGETANCVVQILVPGNNNSTGDTNSSTISLINVTVPCYDLFETTRPTIEFVPGSNLYVSTWTCMASSVHMLLRWKAQQALQFAQAQEENRMRQEAGDNESSADPQGADGDDALDDDESSGLVGDDQDDLEEFMDAVNN